MHIKKVEIFGFKSFGFKNTQIRFEQGLVSIVGANGSGKSNILDAILFALGETRPSRMRAESLAKLINDRQDARRGSMPARASVHFDNSDRKMPVDSDSVIITREMSEKGESVYYLNRRKVSRKYMVDMLDMAGAGIGNFNSIQQGTIMRISEFSPEEKRKTIEDLTGLTSFDDKKAEAERQLEEADSRLAISLARLDEVKKMIDDLEEERNQKMRHDQLESELGRYRIMSAAMQLAGVTSEIASKRGELRRVADAIDGQAKSRDLLRKEIDATESEKSDLMSAADAFAKAKADIDRQLGAAIRESQGCKGMEDASCHRIAAIESRLKEILNSIGETAKDERMLDDHISKADAAATKAAADRDAASNLLSQIDSKRGKVLERQSQEDGRRAKIDAVLRNLDAKLSGVKVEHSTLSYARDDLNQKISSNAARMSDMKDSLAGLEGTRGEIESAIGRFEESAKALDSAGASLQRRRAKTRKDVADLREIVDKAGRAAVQYESKMNMIKKFMHDDYTVARLRADADKLGIAGTVYELIQWDKKHERPILAAGADWINAIVVKDFATLLGLAEVVRKRNLPRLKIIPLDAVPPPVTDPPRIPGVEGILSGYVRCDAKYAALRDLLFGGIVLANAREAAYSASCRGYDAVTLDGEYFKASGSAAVINVHSRVSKLTRLVSMSGDISSLGESVRLTKSYMRRMEQRLSSLEESLESNGRRREQINVSLTSARDSLSTLNSQIPAVRKSMEQAESRASQMLSEADALDSRISDAESRRASLLEEVSRTGAELEQGGHAAISAELSSMNDQKRAAEESSTQAMNEYQKRILRLNTLRDSRTKAGSRRKTLLDEQDGLLNERRSLEETLEETRAKATSLEETLAGLRSREQEMIASSGSSIGDIREYDKRLGEMRRSDQQMSRSIESAKRRADSIERDLRDLRGKESDLQRALQGADPRKIGPFDVRPMINDLEKEHSTLAASLNARAPETYLEKSDGYRSVSKKKNMLEEERNKIVSFIDEIEREKRQLFLDTFDMMDKEIRMTFNKMTGGNAWLELENEDDIFNSGISYMIQFPDKPKRESISISGGEKTLAATVFILALQKLKPSPFYLFDEADAHLDAPNAERFATILEERARESQFIIVSLKDTVVKKAQMMYGVFPKNGISQVVMHKDRRVSAVQA